MSFTVSLHKEPKMAYNIKYRDNFTAAALFTTTAVNVGNFSNLNLFCDNSVELACGELVPPISTYERATECNYIKIVWGAYTVIGLITDWNYINDGNVSISYNVDSFMSARESGLIDEMKGICERVNMQVSNFKSNLQSEPLSPSDIIRVNADLTASFNAGLQALEQMPPSWDGVNDANTKMILTVSPAIVEYLGVGAFANPGAGFAQTLKNRATLNFYAADTMTHCGGTYRGTPLKFDNITQTLNFIRQILGGCGFRTQLSANGAPGQNAVSYNSYLTDANTGAGQSNWQYKNTSGDPMESIRFITIQDIYNLYCIPQVFATPINGYPNKLYQARGFKSIGNLHKWGGENAEKFKLMAHPYYYTKVVTANGDTMTIIPQSHYYGDTISNFVNVWVRYIGGDSPKIQGVIAYEGSGQGNPTATTFAADWFTVRNYPAVTLSVNDSFNPQVQRDVGNSRKLAASYANSMANYRLSNPIKAGYWDSVNGTKSASGAHSSGNQGAFGQIGGFFGGLLGGVEGGNHEQWGNLFENKPLQENMNEANTMNAGNFISPDTSVVMGNDFTAQFSVPGFAAYDCGATDTEMFTFSRYLEEFGQSCNCIINPLDNSGVILGGEGTVTPINGRTFYQFGNIQITGNMPVQWKNNIKGLFESGVYLLDN